MSDTENSDNLQANMSPDEAMATLFANMVMQQTNMALMFLGKVPHPETKQPVMDLEMAQVFIDYLEMLAVKTKGNLDKREEGLLKQSLTAVRLAFVEAARESAEQPKAEAKAPSPVPNPAPAQPGGAPQPAPEADSHKKFQKKY